MLVVFEPSEDVWTSGQRTVQMRNFDTAKHPSFRSICVFSCWFEFFHGSFAIFRVGAVYRQIYDCRCPNRARHSVSKAMLLAQLVSKLLRLSNTLRYEVLVPRP